MNVGVTSLVRLSLLESPESEPASKSTATPVISVAAWSTVIANPLVDKDLLPKRSFAYAENVLDVTLSKVIVALPVFVTIFCPCSTFELFSI